MLFDKVQRALALELHQAKSPTADFLATNLSVDLELVFDQGLRQCMMSLRDFNKAIFVKCHKPKMHRSFDPVSGRDTKRQHESNPILSQSYWWQFLLKLQGRLSRPFGTCILEGPGVFRCRPIKFLAGFEIAFFQSFLVSPHGQHLIGMDVVRILRKCR